MLVWLFFNLDPCSFQITLPFQNETGKLIECICAVPRPLFAGYYGYNSLPLKIYEFFYSLNIFWKEIGSKPISISVVHYFGYFSLSEIL